ncbi:SAC3/GANP/Nin1/mts3/eIF-3 p25 family-domain-containing protein [Podospora conica]|nr:SAC3/GANP/Nin1/mts3/eIF-3 p25 family-domain-containing protein [Schizothecium conicum]
MAAPANNPFGTPSLGTANPFGAPASMASIASPFGAPAPSAFNTNTTTPSASPFAKPSPFGAPNSALTPAFGSPAPTAFTPQAVNRQPSPNPFGAPISQAPAGSGFPTAPKGPAQSSSPFPSQPRSFGAPSAKPSSNANTMTGFGKNSTAPKSAFGKPGQKNEAPQSSPFNPFKNLGQKAATGAAKAPPAGPKGFQRGQKNNARVERIQPGRFGTSSNHSPNLEPTARTKELSPFAFDYANKLYVHLRKGGIRPPTWPPQIGNPSQMDVAGNLKESYKKYRVKVYEALRKADLIDDPERRRKLTDALPFKGVCEGMCPDYEVATRIAESDVQPAERIVGSDGRVQPDPTKMVKKFARSSAGQDQPLPMDVRSVDALRRTTDYLFYDLLQSDDNLPNVHNFLWDRTRAVRKDFTFHSEKTGEEMKDLVYCFEAIARFHATSLHLLRRQGLEIRDGYDPAQECQQLGAALLSLTQAYDDCREKGVTCENEAEFRAYWLLINAHDEKIENRMLSWGKEFWFESEEVQTAIALINAKKDIRSPRGPMRPRRGPALSDSAFANFFEIVQDSRVSYTMACVASIYFNDVRRSILRNLVRAYARHRDAPRTITASDLNKMLKFDTVDEAITFAEAHDFEFSSEAPAGKPAPPEPYLVLNSKKKYVPEASVKQFLSHELVERKRGSQSLPYVIYNTIYEEEGEKHSPDDSPDSLFVTQTNDYPIDSPPMPSPTNFGTPPQTTSPFGTSGTPPAQAGFQASPSRPLNSPASLGAFGQPAAGAHNPFGTPAQAAPSSPFGAGSTPTPSPAIASPAAAASSATPGAEKLVSVFGETPRPSPFAGLGSSLTFGKNNSTPAQLPLPGQNALTPAKVAPSPLAQPSGGAAPTAPGFFGQANASPSAFAPNVGSSTSTAQPSAAPAFAPTQNKGPAVPSISVSQPSPSLAGPTGASTLPQPGSFFSAKPASTPVAAPTPPPSAPSQVATTPPAPSKSFQPPLPPTRAFAPPTASSSNTAPPPSTSSSAPKWKPAGPMPPPPPPPAPPRDLMGDFSKWFALGDTGLMEQFMEHTIGELVAQTFNKFKQDEAERIRREEDAQSWAEARKFRVYSLGVKYFYRWQEKARARATQRILREGKERMRLYREQERLAQKKAQEAADEAAREARRESRRNIMANGEHLSFLALSGRNQHRAATTEAQLLATGIFSGLRDEQAAARRVVNGSPRSQYAESVLELEPPPPRAAGSPGGSSVTSKGEGWKTRSLREKLSLGGGGHRRSASSASSSVATVGTGSNLRKSLPASRVSNFSRKRSAEESSVDGGGDRNVRSKTTATANGFRTSHWDLRARGFVPMPDGKWLPEALARSRHTAASPEEDESLLCEDDDTDANSVASRLRVARLGFSGRRSGGSRSRSPAGGKRKRGWEGGEEEGAKKTAVEEEGGYGGASAVVRDVQKMVRELREAMDLLEEDRAFLREQSGVLGDGT